jgi:hypothetical protein
MILPVVIGDTSFMIEKSIDSVGGAVRGLRSR